jgi:hypothetical protein
MHAEIARPVMGAKASGMLEVKALAFRMLVAHCNATRDVECGQAIS